jgi:hypothetical protein
MLEMNKPTCSLIVILTLICLLSAAADPTVGGRDRAPASRPQASQPQIRKLRPRDFLQLPPAIIRSLEARGCLIPQSGFRKGPGNVIRGTFKTAGQKDWAVLCSRHGASSILIFWGGSTKSVSVIAPGKESNDCSRGITTVGRKFIFQHYKWYGGPKPPPIRHQGIDDGFCEKASMVRYMYRGRWLNLQGAD